MKNIIKDIKLHLVAVIMFWPGLPFVYLWNRTVFSIPCQWVTGL